MNPGTLNIDQDQQPSSKKISSFGNLISSILKVRSRSNESINYTLRKLPPHLFYAYINIEKIWPKHIKKKLMYVRGIRFHKEPYYFQKSAEMANFRSRFTSNQGKKYLKLLNWISAPTFKGKFSRRSLYPCRGSKFLAVQGAQGTDNWIDELDFLKCLITKKTIGTGLVFLTSGDKYLTEFPRLVSALSKNPIKRLDLKVVLSKFLINDSLALSEKMMESSLKRIGYMRHLEYLKLASLRYFLQDRYSYEDILNRIKPKRITIWKDDLMRGVTRDIDLIKKFCTGFVNVERLTHLNIELDGYTLYFMEGLLQRKAKIKSITMKIWGILYFTDVGLSPRFVEIWKKLVTYEGLQFLQINFVLTITRVGPLDYGLLTSTPFASWKNLQQLIIDTPHLSGMFFDFEEFGNTIIAAQKLRYLKLHGYCNQRSLTKFFESASKDLTELEEIDFKFDPEPILIEPAFVDWIRPKTKLKFFSLVINKAHTNPTLGDDCLINLIKAAPYLKNLRELKLCLYENPFKVSLKEKNFQKRMEMLFGNLTKMRKLHFEFGTDMLFYKQAAINAGYEYILSLTNLENVSFQGQPALSRLSPLVLKKFLHLKYLKVLEKEWLNRYSQKPEIFSFYQH